MKTVEKVRTERMGRNGHDGATGVSAMPGNEPPGDAGTMNAIVQHGYGEPARVLRLGDVNRPSPGDDDVLIRMRATSVSTPDWAAVTGIPYVIRVQSGVRRPRTLVRGTDVVIAVEREVQDGRP